MVERAFLTGKRLRQYCICKNNSYQINCMKIFPLKMKTNPGLPGKSSSIIEYIQLS